MVPHSVGEFEGDLWLRLGSRLMDRIYMDVAPLAPNNVGWVFGSHRQIKASYTEGFAGMEFRTSMFI